MSIYKRPSHVWVIVMGKNPVEAVDTLTHWVLKVLQDNPNEWASYPMLYKVFDAKSSYRQDYIIAAIRTLEIKDAIRFDPKRHKIQYKPTQVEEGVGS